MNCQNETLDSVFFSLRFFFLSSIKKTSARCAFEKNGFFNTSIRNIENHWPIHDIFQHRQQSQTFGGGNMEGVVVVVVVDALFK